MSFISFNLNYYRRKVEHYEKSAIGKSDVYEAKQLLKSVDDLVDEGYFGLYDALQKELLIDRLKAVICANGEKPFEIVSKIPHVEYSENSIELSEYIDGLLVKAGKVRASDNAFLKEVEGFCKSIGYEETIAYVFLLRDTLLPYVYYKTRNADNVFPWLISRGFLKTLYADVDVDDIVRAVIFDALGNGITDFECFHSRCKNGILHSLESFPKIVTALRELLSGIKSDKIMVVETGCNGTFPMLLSALDDRVTFRMYTTAPYLSGIYRNNIYTAAYENLRTFETLYSHDSLFRLSDFYNNKFYVAQNKSGGIVTEALREIGYFLK